MTGALGFAAAVSCLSLPVDLGVIAEQLTCGGHQQALAIRTDSGDHILAGSSVALAGTATPHSNRWQLLLVVAFSAGADIPQLQVNGITCTAKICASVNSTTIHQSN